jgi:RecA-family ATPase
MVNPKAAWAALNAAAGFRRLAEKYRMMAAEYPRYQNADLAECQRMKERARWYVGFSRSFGGPVLP